MEREELLQQAATLIEKTQGIAFIVPEDTGFFSIDDDMVQQVRGLIDQAVELLRDLTGHYDTESKALHEGEGDDLLSDIGAQISSELAAREVSGLAFVARGQLMEMRESLNSALEHKQVWVVASHSDAGLRQVGKALIAIESAICEYEGFEARDRRWVDLDDSLEIRRLYSQFRRAVLRGGEPQPDQLTVRLRSAATRIAILRNLEIYPFLRIDDRLTIRKLQKRILAWLAGEDEGGEQAGLRLWQDLVSFARLLVKVNDREELREHDRQAVTTIHRMLFSANRSVKRLSENQLKELERLVGRDDDLDQLILNAERHPVEELQEPLEWLRDSLQSTFASVPLGIPLLDEE
ncbi:MAG: hypothetical protein GY719_24185 [bacterium]|nr:hypothetical protein [bacterium]